MRAGVYCADITPPIGVHLPVIFARGPEGMQLKGAHDPVQARALVLSEGDTTVAVVATDLAGLRSDAIAYIRRRVQEETGIPGSNVLVTNTHTHSAGDIRSPFGMPDHPVTWVRKERIVGAVVMAHRHMVDGVKVRYAVGHEASVLYNRRKRVPGGVCTLTSTRSRFNLGITRFYEERLGVPRPKPPELPETIEMDGPVDGQTSLVLFEDPTGRPVASILVYACHPVILSLKDEHISADFVGPATALIERELGAPCLFLQGTSGDVRPLYDANTYAEAVRVGRAVGAEALRSLADVKDAGSTRGPGRLRLAAKPVELRLRSLVGPKEVTRKRLEELQKQWEELRGGDLSLAQRRAIVDELVTLRWLQSIDVRVSSEDVARGAVTEEVQVLQIGDVGFVALPGEIFVETGMWIKRQAPFPLTIPISLPNDTGYRPTREEFELGGYEVSTSVVQPGSAEKLASEALTLV